MKSLSVLLVALSLFAVSCERHEFEGPDGTKQLHEHHGAGHGHDEHGDDHGHDDHEHKDDHKKEAH